MIGNRLILFLKIFTLFLFSALIASCAGKPVKSGMLILTEAPEISETADYSEGVMWRYLPGARIIAVHIDEPGKTVLLTEDFHSACFPEISYDGKNMLFTAQKNEGDPWQIWEMNLRSLKSRKITSSVENCTDPVYLPGEMMAFSMQTDNDTIGKAHCLYVCKLDGSGLQQITFSPASNFATTALKDGRLITVSTTVKPEMGNPILMVMRPDGTKADMFYKGAESSKVISSISETNDRHLLFIETEKGDPDNQDLVSISYNRPLHTRKNLTSGIDGSFRFALPVTRENYLVSYRKSDSDLFAIYEFDSSGGKIGRLVFSDPGYNAIDAVVAEKYERPKKLPSEVDMQVKTGLIMCQDINVFNAALPVSFHETHKAHRIELTGIDTTYGVVEVEEDGSFYLKVIADTPFQIRTIDDNGNVISGPCSWLWLRPNERRGCVGCHEDPELVPRNQLSLAVTKPPVIIPVYLTEITEKSVELE
ncbi:MAG: hypothetical protein GYA41_01530 [Bacteroidales bacterium]|nr:hypothetical protein [Bacteroidales bacterium]